MVCDLCVQSLRVCDYEKIVDVIAYHQELWSVSVVVHVGLRS